MATRSIAPSRRRRRVRIAEEAHAIFRRRRHQARRPPQANIKPGSQAPAAWCNFERRWDAGDLNEHHEDRTPTHGYEATREAAMAAAVYSLTRRSPASPWVTKSDSPLSSIRRILQTRGHSCADPRPSCRVGCT
jgi:hypothetical protein